MSKKAVRGTARLDKKTKQLVQRVNPGEIAIIDHRDLDELAASSLAEKRVKGVINLSPFISGKYPNTGPGLLAERGIFLLEAGRELEQRIKEGDLIEVQGEDIYKGELLIGRGRILDAKKIRDKMVSCSGNLEKELDSFVQNTLEYARREKGLVTGKVAIPPLSTVIKNRHVLVVVRGQKYREDFRTIVSYIREVRPVIIGVDGGADFVRELGFKPHIIIGDMDSVQDETLRCGAEIIVHAYPDGDAPGLKRIRGLGLEGALFAAPGTSEDIALLLAYEKGAELIVALGTHSNMLDFLEKGRKGMASTFLVRLKVGSRLVDARGVSQLYQGRVSYPLLAGLLLAAFMPVLVLAFFSPRVQHIFYLAFIKIRLALGGG